MYGHLNISMSAIGTEAPAREIAGRHNGQLTVMFVGGPNQRKDYHIQGGEELFYQLEGDMCLKIIEDGKPKDIHIKQGEMFLLPARIPHSPQRFENTVGLVIERRRLETERDGLRYYVEDSSEVLFEKWFYCQDLGKQLVPIINEFFNSKQYKTGKPDPDQLLEEMPFPLNPTKVMEPFCFEDWIHKHRVEINEKKYLSLFEDHHDMKAIINGSGQSKISTAMTDKWIWQLEGTSAVTLGGKTIELEPGDSLLIKEHSQFSWNRHNGCLALCLCQEPAQTKCL